MSDKRNLIIITGQEGAGKSTIVRSLLPHTPCAAQIDAEDVGQTNPWEMSEDFILLLWKNVSTLMNNFWDSGFSTVLAASFLSTYEEYKRFQKFIPVDTSVFIIQLCASKQTRDRRRINRSKPTCSEWRDDLDNRFPEDTTIASALDNYRYIGIENGNLTVRSTIDLIKKRIPEIYEIF